MSQGTRRTFSLAEAQALMPEVQRRTSELIVARADLAALQYALARGASTPAGGKAEAKALEAQVHEIVEWLTSQGIQVKGIAPLLLDFPAYADGALRLLCWLEGEAELGWYHDVELGFPGRRPVSELSTV